MIFRFTTFSSFFSSLHSDLSPSSHSSYIDGVTPTLHLIAYSVNQKGRSEPTVLEDIAINEVERRTGTQLFSYVSYVSIILALDS